MEWTAVSSVSNADVKFEWVTHRMLMPGTLVGGYTNGRANLEPAICSYPGISLGLDSGRIFGAQVIKVSLVKFHWCLSMLHSSEAREHSKGVELRQEIKIWWGSLRDGRTIWECEVTEVWYNREKFRLFSFQIYKGQRVYSLLVIGFIHWDSRMTLSVLCIRSSPALVQPSELNIPSASFWRGPGWMYSGKVTTR